MSRKLSYMKGIHSILTTPLNEDHTVDYEGLRRNVEFGAASNVEALIILGTQGEFYAFDTEEKKEIIRVAVEAAAGKKPVIAGTSDSGTFTAVKLTQFAKDVGADAVIVTPPYYAAVSLDNVYAHFEKLNQVGIPIVLYNAPPRQGYNIPPEFLVKLTELENIVAIKQATQNIVEQEKTLALLGEEVSVFGGSEAFMYPVLSIGHCGTSTTAATCFPQYFVDMYEAVGAGDHKKAKAMFDDLEPFRRVCEKLGHAAVVKYISEKYFGLAGGPMRLPLKTPSLEELSIVDDVVKKLGIVKEDTPLNA
ncbi:dihydrodipicolinate synthase family protein [Mesobacillus subterraneus]|uniref:dihydrodipicolinate synthase family protein n=1 Tax=Mesobacillus subterraneus TaxID=285983 RepID=UPI00203C07A7|nr:dihydrodipicolinate synthase family protein [Mesobacillus subterraneus]MCM3666288.1 dihydrodipicolinate synthase family protein [Mesobacillus subterraneus]MCM3685286.1 dihydrodipicolinate synthase family protein [Mesobacillus subterraneus]